MEETTLALAHHAPLSAVAADGVLSIGIETLALAAEGSRLWPAIIVRDLDVFGRDLAKQLLSDEAEDGTLPLHRVFDDAFEALVEDGCEGIEYSERMEGETPSPDRDPIEMRLRAMGRRRLMAHLPPLG
jgi:hypothetical protein